MTTANTTEKKKTPFDFITSASHTKTDLSEHIGQYVPFIVNKGFSYFQDTILHANEMNIHHSIPKEHQYSYYMTAIKARKRFSKWAGKNENKDTLDLIQRYFQCNRTIAKQYLSVLTPENVTEINNRLTEGGAHERK